MGKDFFRTIFLVVCIIFFVFGSGIVYGIQPSLPTSLYGRVTTSEGEAAPGVEVTARFIDSDGNVRRATTYTLTQGEANALGDASLAGYFLFSSGYVQADYNTNIEISINGFLYHETISSPGGIITIPHAQLTAQKVSSSSSGIGSSTSGSFGSSSGSGVGTGQGVSGQGGEGVGGFGGDPFGESTSQSSSLSGEGEGDGSGVASGQGSGSGDGSSEGTGTSTGTQPGKGTGRGTGQGSGVFEDGFSTVFVPLSAEDGSSEEIVSSSVNPAVPTNVYGQLLDEIGQPLEGETITAEYTDVYGNNHSVETTTLTEEQAEALGDPSLVGNYMFTEGAIKAAPNSSISIRTQPRALQTQIGSEPGKVVKADSIKLYGVRAEKKEGRTFLNQIVSSTGEYIGDIPRKPRRIVLLVSILLGIILLWIGYTNLKKKGGIKILLSHQLYRDLSFFEDKKIEKVMTKEVVSVNEKASCADALETAITRDMSNVIVEKIGQVRGVVYLEDFLPSINAGKSFRKVNVTEIMRSNNVIMKPDDSLSQCLKNMVSKKTFVVPIFGNKKLKGVVSASDVLKEIHEFFSKNEIESYSVPLVQSVMTKDVVMVSHETKLQEIFAVMESEKSDFVVLDAHDETSKRNEVYLITLEYCLNEFYKSSFNLKDEKVSSMIPPPSKALKPGVNILRALQLMVDLRTRMLPVAEAGEMVGAVHQYELLNAFASFMEEILHVLERKKQPKKKRKPKKKEAKEQE